ncbi:hypothetical protein UFOVP860_52 [uncultured Caudovirales phage]|uniref:Uncharacterized protein n=1 Tax=uncultured Caudovirales phage TaxID=2100421 RepID=A0A6J5P9L8_9CAUD|nr:hypothetical protein UFOVP860_52 [uncultured Caudovirales phage]CAB4195812.1 hypothetical protein UFOVP1293_59 [uncultured Caudovirales phage]CAB4222598.1 hypothetical protein UFOVP1644_77 [uncultured Caudovirales phage]
MNDAHNEARQRLELPWVAKECPTGWEIQCETGGWLFQLNDRPNRSAEWDQSFIESQAERMAFIVTAANVHHDMLAALKEIIREVDTISTPDALRVTRDGVALVRAAFAKAEGRP